MKMSSSTTDNTPSISSLDSLTDEERIIYNELSNLSTKIRMLDEIYYGGGASTVSTTTTLDSKKVVEEVSDDEYDALARREVEICTTYPKLLSILEKESGLGTLVTRFGGRVGQFYTTPVDAAGDDKSDKKKKKSKKKKGTAAKKKKKRIKRLHLQNSPMQSLDNAMNDVEAVNWINRMQKLLLQSSDNSDDGRESIQIMGEPKIDGLSLSLRYQLRDVDDDNESSNAVGNVTYDFIWGATRGDGKQGEDVTEAVQSAWMNERNFTIPQSFTIPGDDNMPPPNVIEVRGEVVLPQQAFDEFTTNVTNINSTANSSSSNSSSTKVKTFSNARNAASGILLRSKEPTSNEEIESTRFLQSHLQFYAYDIVSSETENDDDLSSSWMSSVIGGSGNEMRDSLTKLGFHVPTPVVMETLDISHDKEFNETDIPNLLAYHKKMMSTRDAEGISKPSTSSSKKEADFPYQIDGVVYKLSSFNDRQVCGSSSRTPRWAIAHKFPPQVAITRLIDVDVQVGRTGALTPVAILEPIDLGGVLVSRASLHNFYFARSLLIPKKNTSKGDEDVADGGSSSMNVKKGVSVLVSRAGDVIPQVKKRVYESDDEDVISHKKYANEVISLEAPQTCPACGSPTSCEFVSLPPKKSKRKKKGDDTEVESVEFTADAVEESGQVLRCSGPQLLCQPRAVNALAYAYSRAGLDVKGLSKAKLNHLMDEGIIRFPSDLFTTFGSKDGENTSSEDQKDMLRDIAELPGWGEQSAQNVAESVRLVASEGVDLSRYIYALGIPTIGTHVSQLIASAYGDVDSFLKALDEASLYTDNINGDEEEDEENNNESKLIPFATLTGDDTSEKVKGIGPTAISAMVSFSKEGVLLKAANDLANVLTVHSVDNNTNITSTTNQGGITGKQLQFKDMTVVFTGSIPGMSRTVAQKTVKELGAKSTPNTVSKSTTLVVEGEKGGKKARQAKELGVRVIDYTEFMKMIET